MDAPGARVFPDRHNRTVAQYQLECLFSRRLSAGVRHLPENASNFAQSKKMGSINY